MRPSWTCFSGVMLLVCIVSFSVPAAAKSPAKPSHDDKAAELVTAALEAELAGSSAKRAELLRQAQQLDPKYAPARWHAGFVQWNGHWMKVDDAILLAHKEGRLDAYRKRRDALVDTADNHRELAHWCRKSRLPDQAKLHWQHVLSFDPHDTDAQTALKLKYYNGELLTRDQIQEKLKQADIRTASVRKWQPRLVAWCEAAEHGTAEEQAEAVKALSQVTDDEALAALLTVLNDHKSRANATRQMLVEAIGRIPGEEAKRSLLSIAIDDRDDHLRMAAAEILSQRPALTVVPLLLAEFREANPIAVETSYNIMPLGGGNWLRTHSVVLRDNQRTRVIDLTSLYTYGSRRGRVPPMEQMFTDELRAAQGIEREAAELQRSSDHQHAAVQTRNKRVAAVVAKIDEVPLGDDPSLWQQRWNNYTESYTPPKYPSQSSNVTEYLSFFRYRHLQLSCFPAGTLVTTALGRLPIETIREGDLVLAQDAASGELTFKCVLGTTLRPAAPLIKLRMGSRDIVATRGHPFWVNGRGWQMAKHVSLGDSIHSLAGAVPIEGIDEAPAAEAYNLIVSDFNTYFVGDAGLLVHDNLPLSEVTTPAVPGLAFQDASP